MIAIGEELKAYKAFLTISNFKPSTIQAYVRTLENFFNFQMDNGGGEIPSQEDVQLYLLERIDGGKSWSTINADYSSLRKYFKIIKDYEWSLKKLPRPKQDHQLPTILSKEEVSHLISSAPNLKYQTFLTFLYSTGVRLSEACSVKLVDIDSNRMQIRIALGKGGKDRMISFPEKLLELLRHYYKVYRPEEYLFNGRKVGSAYSTSAGQWTMRRARVLAGIKKQCSIHTLRNCYATHHLELGTGLSNS